MAPVDAAPGLLRVEVIYCAARGQVDSSLLSLPPGATALEAVRASGLLERHPSLATAQQPDIGIWSRRADADQPLRDGDRVEVYRRLLVEPKDARRERQRHQRRNKGAAVPPGPTAG